MIKLKIIYDTFLILLKRKNKKTIAVLTISISRKYSCTSTKFQLLLWRTIP